MIEISQGNLSIPDLYRLSETERLTYMLKERSRVLYRYHSVEELLFELRTRAAIVQAAFSILDGGAVFATFEQSRCNPMYWILTPEGGFRMRPDVRPADAIRDIFVNGRMYAYECATAVIIVLYGGVLSSLGDAVFNRLFHGLYLRDWNVDYDLRLTTVASTDEAYPGDILYFKNPDFPPENPEWQGENVVLLGIDTYYGHGIGIRSGEGIIAELNRYRAYGSMRSAYLLDQTTFADYRGLFLKASQWGMP